MSARSPAEEHLEVLLGRAGAQVLQEGGQVHRRIHVHGPRRAPWVLVTNYTYTKTATFFRKL